MARGVERLEEFAGPALGIGLRVETIQNTGERGDEVFSWRAVRKG
jgi:hypothetical protein